MLRLTGRPGLAVGRRSLPFVSEVQGPASRRLAPTTTTATCAVTAGATPARPASAPARPPPWATPGDDADDPSAHAWLRSDLALVLVTPRIPHNTGASARTAAAAGVPLHIVGPAGFSLADRDLKRAGLDYWRAVAVAYHDDWAAFMASLDRRASRLVAFSKFGRVHHATPGLYAPPEKGGRTYLLFGAETSGLPPECHSAADAVVRVPIVSHAVRSLNLAVSAGVGVFEALRQLDGPVLTEETACEAGARAPGMVGVERP